MISIRELAQQVRGVTIHEQRRNAQLALRVERQTVFVDRKHDEESWTSAEISFLGFRVRHNIFLTRSVYNASEEGCDVTELMTLRAVNVIG